MTNANKKYKIFIIHGTDGHPEENWFPWLKKKIEELGHIAYVPEFPTPENQSLDNWLRVFDDYLDLIDEDTIFVAHSIGPSFILSFLEKIDLKIKASFFVAGFTNQLHNLDSDFQKLIETFLEKDFDWNKIKNNCKNFQVYHSDNDPYVPLREGEELAKNLGVKLNVIKGAEHFNKAAGYLEFEELLADIKKEIN